MLKSLELDGFKSFVDATHIDFTAGFTAIVGPNGCGKSNVSDAIRWVIGEQSSKSLRGTKSVDLIFNGSATRKPVNRAEISLTLTDVPPGIRIANVPNIAEEVKITRCYHRSGESEFYINQVPCRLKDITDFLLDVGISPKVLTVIEQGHIQDIIVSKPENRRILIEEAAGILKFKHRKNEAIRKLDASTQNLERITDIVHELGRQAESLKRQAAKAERYKKYQTEVKELSLKLFAKKIRQYKIELEAIEKEFTLHSEQKTESNARASSLDNQISQLNLEIEEALRTLNEKRDRVYQLANQIGKSEHSIDLKKSQIEQSETDIRAATEDITRLHEEIADHAAQAEDQRNQLGTLSEEINSADNNLAEQIQALDEKRSALSDLDSKVKSEDVRVVEIFHHISQKKSDMTALETRQETLEHRDEKLKTEQEATRAQVAEVRLRLSEAEAVVRGKSDQLEELKNQRETLQQKTEEHRERLQSETDRLSSVKEEYLTQSSLLSSLKELRSKFEGFQDGVKSLMTQSADGGSLTGLREVLADVLKTPAEYETAIAAALGEKLQSVIVNSYDDSVEAIDYLKKHSSGRGSFIPMNMKSANTPPVQLNGNPGILGKAVDFVECEAEYRQVIDLLLRNVVLVTDLQTAIQVFQKPEFNGTVVTRNGEMIDAQGMVFGGSTGENPSSLLSQNREMEELSVQTGRLRDGVESARNTENEHKKALAEMERELGDAAGAAHQAEIALNNSRNDHEQQQKEMERLEEKLSTLEYERRSGQQEIDELNTRKATLTGELEECETEKIQVEESLNTLRGELASCREAVEEKSFEISNTKVLLASLKGKRENTLTEINRLDLQQENHRHQIRKRESDKVESQEKIDETRQAIESVEKEILESAREKDRLEEEAVRNEETLREKEESVKRMELETKNLSRKIQELTETISKIELKRSEIKIQMAHIEERTFEDFNVTLPELMNRPPEDFDVQEVDESVRELKQKIGRMGEVNLAALSDFQKTNERYVFLKPSRRTWRNRSTSFTKPSNESTARRNNGSWTHSNRSIRISRKFSHVCSAGEKPNSRSSTNPIPWRAE